jgi:hypothetical protein
MPGMMPLLLEHYKNKIFGLGCHPDFECGRKRPEHAGGAAYFPCRHPRRTAETGFGRLCRSLEDVDEGEAYRRADTHLRH